MNMIVQSFAPDDRAVKTVCGGSKEARSEGDPADEGRVRGGRPRRLADRLYWDGSAQWTTREEGRRGHQGWNLQPHQQGSQNFSTG